MKHDIQTLTASTLRIGVSLACIVAFIGGMLYLIHHGGETFDWNYYSTFDYAKPECHPSEYTTFGGIMAGLTHFTATGWIQTGVLILILTPVMRVALSLLDFISERDWLYAVITAVVLAVIISNSLEGVTF